LKDIKIAEIDFDGGWIKNLDIKIPQPAISDIVLSLDPTSNAGGLACSKASTTMSADFQYSYLFFTVPGHMDINVKKLALDAVLEFSTQTGAPTTDLAPKLTAKTIDININSDDVDVELSGGLVAKIAGVFIPLVKSSILPMIVDSLKDQVKTLIDTTVDGYLVQYGDQYTIPYLAGVTADYGQEVGGPKISSDKVFSMQVNGTFFDMNHVHAEKIAPAKFNVRDPKGSPAQVYLTSYVLNTLFDAATTTGNTLDIGELLAKAGVTLTTDQFAKVIPEILNKYKSGQAVDLQAKIVGSPAVTKMSKTEQTIQGSLLITAKVGNEIAIQAEFDNANAAGMISSKNGKVYGSFPTTKIGTIGKNFQTTLGLTAAQFGTNLQALVDKEIAIVNANLTQGVVIPSILGIQVVNAEINFSDELMMVGADVTHTTFENLRDAMNVWADEIKQVKAATKAIEVMFEGVEKFL